MSKSMIWKHSRSPYEIFQLVLEDPRIPKKEIARKFKINQKTAETWWNHAVDRRILIPSVFRRKCYSNFREYFYFLNVEDPHILYQKLQNNRKISYFSVESGFANFFLIAKLPLKIKGEIMLKGYRSDYYVTIPPDHTFQIAISKIRKKLKTLNSFESSPSPLIQRNYAFEPWDTKDEAIFHSICNNMRKPFSKILEETGTYSDKIMKWFRGRNDFGHTITMFFPEGDSSYILQRYFIETEVDSLLIDIFSELPTSTTFYRLGRKLVMSAYLPFTSDRKIVREVMSVLKRKDLVKDYTSSFVEYGFRAD